MRCTCDEYTYARAWFDSEAIPNDNESFLLDFIENNNKNLPKSLWKCRFCKLSKGKKIKERENEAIKSRKDFLSLLTFNRMRTPHCELVSGSDNF